MQEEQGPCEPRGALEARGEVPGAPCSLVPVQSGCWAKGRWGPGRVVLTQATHTASASSVEAPGEGGDHGWPSSLRPCLTPFLLLCPTWGDPSRCGVSLASLDAQRTPNPDPAVPMPAPHTLVPPVTLSWRSQPAWQHPCICPLTSQGIGIASHSRPPSSPPSAGHLVSRTLGFLQPKSVSAPRPEGVWEVYSRSTRPTRGCS